jgi:hypothetical protein
MFSIPISFNTACTMETTALTEAGFSGSNVKIGSGTSPAVVRVAFALAVSGAGLRGMIGV